MVRDQPLNQLRPYEHPGMQSGSLPRLPAYPIELTDTPQLLTPHHFTAAPLFPPTYTTATNSPQLDLDLNLDDAESEEDWG